MKCTSVIYNFDVRGQQWRVEFTPSHDDRHNVTAECGNWKTTFDGGTLVLPSKNNASWLLGFAVQDWQAEQKLATKPKEAT